MSTSVYVCLGADWKVLYVGITSNLKNRIAVHRCMKDWWPEVRQVVEDGTHKDREVAGARERELVMLHQPPYNLNLLPAAERARRKASDRAAKEALHQQSVELRAELLGAVLYSMTQASQYAGSSASGLTKAIKSGDMAGLKIDRHWYTTPKSIDRWIMSLPPIELTISDDELLVLEP